MQFQFLKGSIQALYAFDRVSKKRKFQFLKGSIQAEALLERIDKVNCVSIP